MFIVLLTNINLQQCSIVYDIFVQTSHTIHVVFVVYMCSVFNNEHILMEIHSNLELKCFTRL